MFTVIFNKDNTNSVFYLKVYGIRSMNGAVVWEGPIEYMLAKHFVDTINEHRLPEEELLDATLAFFMELHKLSI